MDKTLGDRIRETYRQNIELKEEVRRLRRELDSVKYEYHRAVLWGCVSVVHGWDDELATLKCQDIIAVYEDNYMD